MLMMTGERIADFVYGKKKKEPSFFHLASAV